MFTLRSAGGRFLLALASALAGGHVSAQPALELSVSANAVRSASQPVDETRPLALCVLGFDTAGSSRLTGSSRFELVPDAGRATVRMTLEGVAVGRAGGIRRHLRVQTLTCASVFVQQDFTFDGKVVERGPWLIRTRAGTELEGVATDLWPLPNLLVRPLVKAGFRATQQRNDDVATEIGMRLLREQSDAELQTQLAQANKSYRDLVLEPLRAAGISPADLTCVSTADGATLRADVPGLAAGTPPPTLPPADVRLSIRQEFLNRQLQKEYAGRTLTGKDLEEAAGGLARRFDIPAPEKSQEKELSVTLDEDAPLTVSFEKGQIVLVLRGAEYTSGDTSYPAMNVTSRWDIDPAGGRLRLVRRPQLEIYPPGFVPGSGARLPFRLLSLRNLLQRRFDRLLPAELDLKTLEPPAALRGQMEGTTGRLTAVKGWLIAEWRRAK